MRIVADWRQLDQFERELGRMRKTALPFAIREATTASAFAAQKVAQRFIKREFTLRNRYILKSIRVDKATDLRRPEAAMGSTAGEMETQEFGGIRTSGGGRSAPLPTGASAGQRGRRPRTKLPTPANRMRRIQLKRRAQGKNRNQALAMAINSVPSGGHVFLEFRPRSRGIFKVTGARRRGGRGRRRKIVMIYNLAASSHRIPVSAWLQPSVVKSSKVAPRLYALALQKQIKRQRLFQRR